MIIAILGLPRFGKTALMTCILRFINAYLAVYTNYSLIGFQNWQKIEPVDLMRLRYCGCGLDEVYNWLYSRCGGTKVTQFESAMVFQSGKSGVIIVYTAQLDSTVDKNLRLLAEKRFVAIKDDVNRVFIYAPVTIDNEILMDESFEVPFDFMKDFVFGKYNTYEKVFPIGFKELLHSVAKLSPERMNQIVDKQIDLVFRNRLKFGIVKPSDVKRVNVEYALMRLGEPVGNSNYVMRGLELRLKELAVKC